MGGGGEGGGGNTEGKWEGNISRIKGVEEREDLVYVLCCKRKGRKSQELLDRPVKKLLRDEVRSEMLPYISYL